MKAEYLVQVLLQYKFCSRWCMQGFWPDGVYTAPCDEALKYDIEASKKVGLNMLRKHIKVEPDRYLYCCLNVSLSPRTSI